jgi:hypothetical protein
MIEMAVGHYHDTDVVPGHRCEPRISAQCAGCGTTYVVCTMTEDAVGLLLIRAWICSPCRELELIP